MVPHPSLSAASKRVKRSEPVRRREFVSKRFRLAVADANEDLRLHDLRRGSRRACGGAARASTRSRSCSDTARTRGPDRYAHLEDEELRAAVSAARGPIVRELADNAEAAEFDCYASGPAFVISSST